MTINQDHTRYEIKLILDSYQRNHLSQWIRLHSAGFITAYPPRRVNNIYFDTIDLDSLNDHVSGVSERRKLRLRWYGESFRFEKSFLEVKQKVNRLGWKETEQIGASIDLHSMTWNEISHLIKESSRDGFKHILDVSNPVLINHYQRKYFKAANDDEVRLSVDTHLITYLQRDRYKPNHHYALPDEEIIILEVKCPQEKSDRITEILGEIPARPEAFSKYNHAMAYTYFI